MNLQEKLKELRQKIEEKSNSIKTSNAEFREMLEKANSEEELTAAKDKRSEIEKVEGEVRKLEEEADLIQVAIDGDDNSKPAGSRNKDNQEASYRDAVNAYIHSRGRVRDGLNFEKTNVGDFVMLNKRDIDPGTDGVKKPDVQPTIADEVSYQPQRELQTIVDLKQFVNVFQAQHGKGTYPILKNATSTMATVAELEKNPAMAKPDFDGVDWAVDTYRQALPISQESLDDSEIDLMPVIEQNGQQIKVNTTNAAIAGVIKTFAAKTVGTIDDLKHIINVDLDPAYDRVMIVSQTFYNWLDTVKDGNGRYLLQDSILTPSGKVLLGMPVAVVADTDLGKANEAHAFIGDIKRSVLFANRADFMVRWVDNEIYGQYLQAGMRFGVAKADTKAGYFLTYTEPAEK
ncbi:phage capsid protein [Ligilactobacillus salitolerans]|uniref:Phage capsid protein n=1 Tax=Ligilactobacillus salitolerans TaxID=1808352 RepID=A0A401ITT9_9LACO|nr:phage major capsid protein [Ligilactobacillus salitolerans]GBG94973.1 phage capsid protein [Ligilactobacillus salitolerans]